MPKGWSITKIEDVCIFESGYAFSSESYQKEGTPLVRISNIKEGFVDLEGCVYVDSIPDSRFIIHDGDLLIAMSGATTGKMGIYHCNRPALLNQRVGNIKTISEQILRSEYRNLYLKSLESQILKDAYGGAQPNISAKDICSYYLLLPPIEEQKRIIATVDRLMSYVDAIENGEEDCKDTITKTKEKVLDLAIHGKLVPQDPTDEPASKLLKRINPKAVASCDNPHYLDLPNGWILCNLENVIELYDNYRKPINGSERQKRKSGKTTASLYPYYGATGLVDYIDSYLLDGQYILLGEDGAPFLDASAKKAFIVQGKFWVNNHAHVLKSLISTEYLVHVLNCFDYGDYVKGSTRLKLTQKDMLGIPVYLPPYNEQLRIVSKVNDIFSRLDMIEKSLQA